LFLECSLIGHNSNQGSSENQGRNWRIPWR
jgi:hypothetical protein